MWPALSRDGAPTNVILGWAAYAWLPTSTTMTHENLAVAAAITAMHQTLVVALNARSRLPNAGLEQQAAVTEPPKRLDH
jgi:hypothetical protein